MRLSRPSPTPTRRTGIYCDYLFAGTEAGSVANYTNRSPYPMLHLLREESVAAVSGGAHDIPRRNVRMLEGLGRENILERLKTIRALSPEG